MLKVSYVFFHHFDPNFPREEVNQALKEHDFKKFIALYLEWGEAYLPADALVCADDDWSKSVSIDIRLPYNFKEITDYESECG